MTNLNMLESLVPITQFNRGQASKIFDRLHSEDQLIVLKNNRPAAVILSPEEYMRLCEIEEDYLLIVEANERLQHEGPLISQEDLMKELGISEEDLVSVEVPEIE